MKNYYLHVADTEQGPFSFDELASKCLTKTTPVWREGLSGWTPAGELDELRAFLPSVPPPFETATVRAGKAVGRGVWQLIRVAAILILCVVGIRLFVQWKSTPSGSSTNSLFDTQKDLVRKNISDFVKLDRTTYHYSALGGISGLSITVRNNTDYMLEHVKVKISYIKADGGLWKDIFVDVNYIPAHNAQTLSIPDTDRGVKIIQQIMTIESRELGLQ